MDAIIGYCAKCRKKQNLIDTREEIIDTKKGKKKFIRGKCSECGTNVSVFTALDNPTKEKIDEDNEVKKLRHKLKEREEELRAGQFKEDVNNNEFLYKQGIIAVDSTWHAFLTAFFIIVLVLGVVAFIYLAWTDHFKSIFSQNLSISSFFNFTTNNNYNFSPNTENNNYCWL